MMTLNGAYMNLGNIMKLSSAVTRSITAENVYGEKGKGGMADLTDEAQAEVAKIGQHWDGPNPCARDLGLRWKVRPCIPLPAGSTSTLMDVSGPGVRTTAHPRSWSLRDQGGFSIPALLVIPGDIGYLKQFFSAQLFVANGAPVGSGLVVRDVTGKIELPLGADGVKGRNPDACTDPDDPKTCLDDDPLALPPLVVDGQSFDLSVSIGVEVTSAALNNSSSLLSRADALLYQAKGRGRNQVVSMLLDADDA